MEQGRPRICLLHHAHIVKLNQALFMAQRIKWNRQFSSAEMFYADSARELALDQSFNHPFGISRKLRGERHVA